jgi:hypothetical protein
MSYTYDLPDFKRFLNDRNDRYRVDGLIFWQNRIPLPVDLFNRMFGEAEFFFELYLDHLMAALVTLAHTKEVVGPVPFASLPAKEAEPRRAQASQALAAVLSGKAAYRNTASRLAGLLGLEGYRPDGGRLAAALCHQGKKYARLYFPEAFREVVGTHHPGALSHIAVDNTDMFGNVIADHYDIYRSGFSDALAIIFNLLLEFRLLCGGNASSLQRISLSVEQEVDGIRVEVKKTRDGSLWEPDYTDDHLLRLNPEHPFFRAAARSGNTTLLGELLHALGKFEYSQFTDAQKKLLENMRQEISREL